MSTATLLFEKTIVIGGVALTITREDDKGQEKIQAQITSQPPFVRPDQAEIEQAIGQAIGFEVSITSYEEADRTYQLERKAAPEPVAVEKLADPDPEPAPASDPAPATGDPPADPAPSEPTAIGPVVDRVIESIPTANGDLEERVEWERNVRQQAGRCDQLDEELKDLESELAQAREAVKDKQGEVNEANRELRKLIAGRDEEAPLFDRKPSANVTHTRGSCQAAADETWRKVPLAELGLPKSLLAKLEDADVSDGTRREIKTVGQLADFTKEYGEKGYSVPLTMIHGIGGAANEKVEAALSEFWAKQKAPLESPPTQSPSSETPTVAADSEAEAPSPAKSWRCCPIEDLDLSEKHAKALAGAEIETVGALADFLEEMPERIIALVGKRAHDRLVNLIKEAEADDAAGALTGQACRVCGCTEADCQGCVERTGEPCVWVAPDLCSACQAAGEKPSCRRCGDVHRLASSQEGKTTWELKKLYRPDQLPAEIVATARMDARRRLCGSCVMELLDKEAITQRLEKKGARRGRGNGKAKANPARGKKFAAKRDRMRARKGAR